MPEYLSFSSLLLALLGSVTGLIVGAIPGLGPASLIALAVPLTLTMNSVDAVVMLVAMYVGGGTGGMISATLLRMPGTPSSIMTTLDAFPMARAGYPERALAIGNIASLVGGLIAGLILLLLARPLSIWGTYFGPWEYFALVTMGLLLMAAVLKGNVLGGLISGTLGLMLAVPGVSAADGALRLTFGVAPLVGGFDVLPVLLGLFVVGTALTELLKKEEAVEQVALQGGGTGPLLPVFKAEWLNLLRSSLIGTWIGILPGVGATIASMVAYMSARAASKTPEKFGTGHPGGIVASESANNANIGGGFVPLISLGIPGSASDAILLGALILHNVQPGPLLFTNAPDLAWGIIVAYLFTTVVCVAILHYGVRSFAAIIRVPKALLYPFMIVFAVLGCYALRNSMFDVGVLFTFGLVGVVFNWLRFPLAPFVIGFVLGGLAETQLRSALMWSDGDYLGILQRPVAVLFLLVAVATMVIPPLLRRWRVSPIRGPAQ